MGYNGREFQEPYNGFGGGESLAASMSNLSVTGSGDQSTSDQSHSNLNPHAAEFVPKAKEMSSSRLDRTNSSNSNASDDEYRRFCRAQLPDDLDLGDLVETAPRFEGSSSAAAAASAFVRPPYMPQQQQQQQQQVRWSDGGSEWGAFPEDLATEIVDPIAVLGSEFPGFASESLAEIYYANGGDLALTMDMLGELELQNEGVMAKQFQAPPAPAPPSPRDFPALAGLETIQLSGRASSFGESRSVPDFVAAVRKQAAQQAAQLQFERNGGVDFARGLSQGVGFARVSHTERLEPFQVQAPATWLDTGDSVSNMYADMREEARDHARVRNAYFDQARQAYLTGNKALAKKLSAKGQWHNEQMKAAHSKAGEAIFYQRNANTFVHNSSPPGQPHLIDLHGLHVGEAIPLLKREIAQLRCTRQRVGSVFICVGTGHHTKGSRTPSRLPAAVQRYLLEEEHLQFTEPQAGMLRIIIR